jgi:hypothetical protein
MIFQARLQINSEMVILFIAALKRLIIHPGKKGIGGPKTMKNCFSLCPAVMAVCFMMVAPGCRQQPQTRQYEETGAADVPAPLQPQAGPSAASWRWVKPPQWREAAGAGLRLATFSIASREDAGQCTLVTLPGDGGGVQANVQRWLEQLHLPSFSRTEMADFLSRQIKIQTGSGLPVFIVDFTALNVPQQRPGPSLLVAMITDEGQTLFVKLSGGKALLGKNRKVFFDFCRSLSSGG